MMKKGYVLTFLWIAAVCAMCCGCGKKSGTILLGEAGNRTGEAVSQDSTASGAEAGALEGAAAEGSTDAANATDAAKGADAAKEPGQGPAEKDTMIRVYVCGAVANPGVVEIAAGSRAEDALAAAGGFGEDAAREAVNLADWVNDGQKLYFPVEGEELEAVIGSAATGGEASSGLVNINTADAAALCTLPGVGESRAADIIAYREANGAFESCEDIMKVSGIKTALYEKIRDKITVK